jgi:phage head maturation protease
VHTTRAQKDDKEFLVLDGYASTVEQGYTMYDFFGPYTEIIDRGAFDSDVEEQPGRELPDQPHRPVDGAHDCGHA